MDYIKETFERMNLRQIRQFLLYGVDELSQGMQQPYKDRLKEESNPIYDRLKSIYSDETELDKSYADLSQALTAYESVYTEIGMKAGASLIYKLLLTDDI